MSHYALRLPRFITLAAALVLPLMLDSCSSSKKKLKGVPANLPVIPIQGSAATPAHSMSHREYPFDSGGNYVSAWAAEGERSAGRGSAASTDYADWKSSHLGESSSSKEKKTASTTKKKPSKELERTPLSPPVKITSTAPKKTSSGASKKTPTTASTASKSTPKKSTATPAKKSATGGSYKVKKGDTLYGIARKSGSTVAKIKAANGLKSDVIRDGQTLTIPK
jgi:LysM repeat protein